MIFIDSCFGKKTPYTPVWMMRQAGRYLPEYRKIREETGDFLSLCKNSTLASEVTLQPVTRLNVDAAILFSDILVVPLEMGMNLEFIKGVGPKFSSPIKTLEDIEMLDIEAHKKLTYVYDTIRLTRDKLDKNKALIGFCGAPWTIATYMIEGVGTKTYSKCKKMIYQNPKLIEKLLEKIVLVLKKYLILQIESGADAVMIFDSWAAALEEKAYLKFGWDPIKTICSFIKDRYPNIPIIAFPKGIGSFLDKIDGNFDVFGVDWQTPLSLAKEKLGKKYVLQGNMEPCRLYDKSSIDDGVNEVLNIMKNNNRHIFNLGHGMLPDLDPENARYMVDLVHKLTKR